MPQCKRADCRVEAVPGAPKRYCAAHLEKYLKRRAEHERVARTLPQCASGVAPDCTGKISKGRFDAGETVCFQCERRAEELYQIQQTENRKRDKLRACGTLSEVKDWIEEHLL